MRVATFNVAGLPSRLAPLRYRAAYFCRVFEESDVDVLCFQEVWTRAHLGVLRARLPSYPYLAWRRGIGGQPAGGLAMFSRTPFGAVSYASYRGTGPGTGPLLFRARLALNTAGQGVLVAPVKEAVVATTHLTANRDGDWSAGSRYGPVHRAQLDRLHETLRPDHRPTVLAGDFNIASDSPWYPSIVDGGWRDPFAGTDLVTFQTALLPPDRPGRRIDYLLVAGDHPVRDTAVLFARPVRLPDGRRAFVSDHLALTASIGTAGADPRAGTGC
jgi:endonuclease/exonuclease/phosphatase family metal-dependent hydrolase